MEKRNNILLGGAIVILGILLLLSRLDIFDIGDFLSNFWPLVFLMLPGFLFHVSFFSGKRRDPGLLVPGGILFVSGLTCQLSELFNAWDILWPGFILSVAIGLFELYLFGGRQSGLLVPVAVLGALSIIFFTSFSLSRILTYTIRRLVVPVALILVGFAIMIGNKPKEPKEEQSQEEQ